MKLKYILKILISLVLAGTLFSACSSKTYTPVLEKRFAYSAVYKTGSFSFNCKIIKTENSILVTPTDTKAKGLTIKFDGETVSFLKDGMNREFSREEIDSTNPAIVIYEVFSSIESEEEPDVRIRKDFYEYSGKTSLGMFKLVQSKSNRLRAITVHDAGIEIDFKSEY